MSGRHWALAAFTALAGLFILAPLAVIILNSFSSVAYNMFPPPGYSTRWYANLAAQSDFYAAALRSVVLGLLATGLALILGTLTAYALTRTRLPGAGAVRAFVLAPIVIPKIVLGVALFMFFVRLGVADHYSSLLMTHTLVTFPFVVAVLSAAFANFDWSLEEAARDLGAGPLTSFFRVLLPEIRTSVIVSAIFAFVIAFDQVETTLFLVRPGQRDAADRDVPLPAEMAGSDHRCAVGRADPFAGLLVAGLGLALRNRQQALGLLSRTKEITP